MPGHYAKAMPGWNTVFALFCIQNVKVVDVFHRYGDERHQAVLIHWLRDFYAN